ncbi:hypothetical protein Zmor_014294 [Zophobas morio]|uniref:Ig-like domain-containing protein n=1 Tax=Zophobas morio TaxID=2755281 RepID=A0AA38IEI0_9CUCU|nr:hypothetical protein Zmor_014294 [Zophobas morio]
MAVLKIGVFTVCLLYFGPVFAIEDYCSSNTYSTNETHMQFTKEPSSEEFAIAGKFKGLHCCAKGYRSIEWYKDGKPYPWPLMVSQLILYPESANQTVYTQSVTEADAGNYTCVLKNDSIAHSHTIQLKVFEKIPDDPKITYVSQDSRVRLGQNLRLFCEAFAGRVDLPDAHNEVVWRKSGHNGTLDDEPRVRQEKISSGTKKASVIKSDAQRSGPKPTHNFAKNEDSDAKKSANQHRDDDSNVRRTIQRTDKRHQGCREAPRSRSAPIFRDETLQPCPARFNGSTNASSVEEFITTASLYKRLEKISDEDALETLPILLREEALTWWNGVRNSVNTWPAAVQLIRGRLRPRAPNHRLFKEIFNEPQGDEVSTDAYITRQRERLCRGCPGSWTNSGRWISSTDCCDVDLETASPVRKWTPSQISSTRPAPSKRATEKGKTRTRNQNGKGPKADENRSRGPRLLCDVCRALATTQPLAAGDHEDLPQLPDRQPGRPLSQCVVTVATPRGCLEEIAPPVTRPTPANPHATWHSTARASTCRCRPSRPRCRRTRTTRRNHLHRVVRLFNTRTLLGADFIEDARIIPDLARRRFYFGGDITRTYPFVDVDGAEAPARKGVPTTIKRSSNHTIGTHGSGRHRRRLRAPATSAAETSIPPRDWEDAETAMTTGEMDEYEMGLFPDGPRRLFTTSLHLQANEGTGFTEPTRAKFDDLVDDFADAFEAHGPPTPYAEHRIDTGDHAPIAVPPYQLNATKKQLLKEEVEKMIQAQVIEECDSPWAAPIVLIPKKDGSVRPCVNYRKLNAVTRPDAYPTAEARRSPCLRQPH